MKNMLLVDIDTDRTPSVLVLKQGNPHQNQEQMEAIMENDVRCLCEALVTLIRLCHFVKYKDREKFLSECVERLTSGVHDPSREVSFPQK